MKIIFLGLIIVAIMQACSAKIVMQSVTNTNWVLTEWPNQTMPNTDKKATLYFSADSTISGKSFCNGFGGSVSIDGNAIKFSELIGTMMYCEDVGVAEGKYIEGLRLANSFKIVDGNLHLLKDKIIIMKFTKTK